MAAVGQTVPMIDAQERVSGRINYVLNVELPGMLFGKILRSPFPHARVVRVDASRAERLAGVVAVLTRSDFIGPTGFNGKYGRIFRDQTVVALDKVRFVGDPVAAVAAVNDDIAAEALSLIEVEYEELPAVFDEEEALKPTAPLVHDPRPEQQPMFSKLIQDLPAGSNLCSHFKLRHGDVEQGFREADFVFEDVFRSPAAQHVPLEPHVTVAQFFQGKLTIWTSTQMPHAIRSQMAELFNLPLARVRVIVETLGGGFGSKGSLRLEPITAFLALEGEPPSQDPAQKGRRVCYGVQTPRDDPDKNRRQERRHASRPPSECRILIPVRIAILDPLSRVTAGPRCPGRTRSPTCGSTHARSGPTSCRRERCGASACPRPFGPMRARWI